MLDDSNAACVTITGEPGIGKTERALQACRYMRERNRFCAIFFAHCRNEETDSCRFPISGGRNTHMQHFCRLVSEARVVLRSLFFVISFEAVALEGTPGRQPYPKRSVIYFGRVMLLTCMLYFRQCDVRLVRSSLGACVPGAFHPLECKVTKSPTLQGPNIQ